jgi:hypothetical protein
MITFPLSFIPLLLQQITWCCRYSKCCMVISSLACFALSAVCIWIGVWHYHECLWACFFIDETVLMVIAFIEAALWFSSGVLTMIFVTSGRHVKWEEWWDARTDAADAIVATVADQRGRYWREKGTANTTIDTSEPSVTKPTKQIPKYSKGDSRSNLDHRG